MGYKRCEHFMNVAIMLRNSFIGWEVDYEFNGEYDKP